MVITDGSAVCVCECECVSVSVFSSVGSWWEGKEHRH